MQPLSIGMNLPNRNLEKSQIEQAITALALSLATQRDVTEGLQTGPCLDVTFMLACDDDKPPFDGMRMGGFNNDERILYFQAAVPEGFNHSARAKDYVAAVLDDVITNAIDFFQSTDVHFDAIGWKRALPPIVTAADKIELPSQ